MKANFNVTEAARRMRKSRVWLSQRLNQCEVNGKQLSLTEQELKQLIEIVGKMAQGDLDKLTSRLNRMKAGK